VRKKKRLSLEELAPYLLPDSPRRDPTAIPDLIRWAELFGNHNPVEIEVGCGKGLFLITAATACPNVNFLGIEIVRKYQLFTATRVAIRKLANVRVACADAAILLRERVPHKSVHAIHVYYPDPWWKKRHHKRRLFTAKFVEICTNCLTPGGQLHIATDVEEYFETIQSLCRDQTGLHELPSPAIHEARHDLDYLTNFERKARKQGHPVFRTLYVKKPTNSNSEAK